MRLNLQNKRESWARIIFSAPARHLERATCTGEGGGSHAELISPPLKLNSGESQSILSRYTVLLLKLKLVLVYRMPYVKPQSDEINLLNAHFCQIRTKFNLRKG